MNKDLPETGVQSGRNGSALIVALWVIVMLSLLVASFAFDMKIEAEITSYYRNRLKADYLAQGGVELARVIINHSMNVAGTRDDEEYFHEDENIAVAAVNLSRGVPVLNLQRELGEGRIFISITPEEGLRNVNLLSRADWEEILDQSNVPHELWDELIATFRDFIEPGDTRRLHGAEPDDPYYTERGYEAKGSRLDSVDELLLVKGFTEEIVYGSPAGTPEDDAMLGIAPWLTTWGHGRVNVNTASREVLLTIRGIDEAVVDAIIEERIGPDGIPGTRDDGFDSLDEVIIRTGMNPGLREDISVQEVNYLRVTTIGEVRGVRRVIRCVLRVQDEELIPVSWKEEQLHGSGMNGYRGTQEAL